ncbi:uncharacterized protein LOC109537631 [Dendroctonus ponderosae]|uniref:Uncharacterized protein n=1 Tax=Dendroctonus ponderosae TaxID=77166 RepID=U4U3V7_DENPD|nr:uncharacterized protein LOC109537631 [Dendroctonus ponderosae]ERL88574.1 hypothetical protein D910_05959 [Dendroctonus ponderosae]KAH1026395.1 hypothetical protein HUJ05_000067 [Dendroctonus ponderosae]KAH1026396.1 hypothetical protein HUJ05_000067 [Dendroctonus ponderosae]
MFSCNCLNIVIEIEKHDKTVKREDLLLDAQEQADEIFNSDSWYIAKLQNIKRAHPGLIASKQIDLWTISHCLNCDVETHAIHKEKGASCVFINAKLLNEMAINKFKTSGLVSTIFNIVVNPNANGFDTSVVDTYPNRNVAKIIKDVNDVFTNYIREEQAAVEERVKKYSDEQYELLNGLKDKAYKEREALVRIIQKAAIEGALIQDLSPKSPKAFGNVSSDKHSKSINNSPEVPFSPKRPKSNTGSDKPKLEHVVDDMMFTFETDEFTKPNFHAAGEFYSDSEEIEEAEDAMVTVTGMAIIHDRSAGWDGLVAKSCPVDIPNFSQLVRNNSNQSKIDGVGIDGLSPKGNGQVDIAASMKALARSVHGDSIFGDLPRPKFSTQI